MTKNHLWTYQLAYKATHWDIIWMTYQLVFLEHYLNDGEAVDWVSIRFVQSLWPHIASVIHESAIQHSDSITACSQHRVIRWLWRMQ